MNMNINENKEEVCCIEEGSIREFPSYGDIANDEAIFSCLIKRGMIVSASMLAVAVLAGVLSLVMSK